MTQDTQPEQKPTTPEKTTPSKQPRAKRRLPKRRIALVVAIVVVVALVASILIGYLYVGVKLPGERVHVVARVCDSSMVSEYNSLVYPLSAADNTKLVGIVNKINDDKTLSDGDPTCQAILYQAAYADYNLPGMKSAYEKLKKQSDKGVFYDNDLAIGISVRAMSDTIEEISSTGAN